MKKIRFRAKTTKTTCFLNKKCDNFAQQAAPNSGPVSFSSTK